MIKMSVDSLSIALYLIPLRIKKGVVMREAEGQRNINIYTYILCESKRKDFLKKN